MTNPIVFLKFSTLPCELREAIVSHLLTCPLSTALYFIKTSLYRPSGGLSPEPHMQDGYCVSANLARQWFFALPEARVFELMLSTPKQGKPVTQISFSDDRNELGPPLGTICSESRRVALRFCKPVTFSGVVKYINFKRDIFFLDDYLQARRLIRIVGLLSKIETLRNGVTHIAFGTTWDRSNFQLSHLLAMPVTARRIFKCLSKFPCLDEITLVVHQQYLLEKPENARKPMSSQYTWSSWYTQSDIQSATPKRGWLRRPDLTKLIPYDPETETPSWTRYTTVQDPGALQVEALKERFERILREFTQSGGSLRVSYSPPKIVTAIVVWIYGVSYHPSFPGTKGITYNIDF
ncbi:hypothetical protein GGR50DRAFT_478871 [Xylaria sp. CBS 124048]|nr:hypothetical protein GGR50DRAFT_478871 [Xylaria sp. CBS 124048]